METKRLLFIDYAKGVAILLMLLQHCTPQHDYFRQITQAFVLPLFFVVGGFIWNYKECSGKSVGLSYGYLIKRGKQLGIPYFLAGIVLILFYWILSTFSGTTSLVENIIKLITFQGIDSLWFLPVYFLSEILFLLLLAFKDNRIIILIDVAILILLVLIVPFEGSKWPFALFEKSLMGCLFFSGGFLFSHFHSGKNSLLIITIVSLLGISCSLINGFASFAELHSPVLFFLSGLALSVAIICILRKYEHSSLPVSKSLSFFGKETLFILCTNNLLIESVRLIDHKVSGDFLLNIGVLGNLLLFFIITLLEVLLIYSSRFLRIRTNDR